MSILDKFKAFLNIEINKPLVEIKINSDNTTTSSNNDFKVYNEKERSVEIFLDYMPQESREKLAQLSREYVEVDNKKFLEETTVDFLNIIRDYNKSPGACEDERIKNFFKDIIPSYDYEALEASLYLRREFNNRRKDENEPTVKRIKNDIRNKFGDRGNNISNLCTAGYFEGFLEPLYKETTKEKFNEIYEQVVMGRILTIFVHKDMDENEITKQIKNKITISRSYGISFIHIHGIGKANILKIKNFIRTQKDFLKFFEKKTHESESILILELHLINIITYT